MKSETKKIVTMAITGFLLGLIYGIGLTVSSGSWWTCIVLPLFLPLFCVGTVYGFPFVKQYVGTSLKITGKGFLESFGRNWIIGVVILSFGLTILIMSLGIAWIPGLGVAIKKLKEERDGGSVSHKDDDSWRDDGWGEPEEKSGRRKLPERKKQETLPSKKKDEWDW